MNFQKQKYIESHWLIFAIKGLIALVPGFFMMLSASSDIAFLTECIGWVMFALGVIEIFNIVYRHRRQYNWGFCLLVAVAECLVAFSLLFSVYPSLDANALIWLRIAILAGFTLLSSIMFIAIGLTSFKNLTDRYMWVVQGVIGAILAFVIFADNGLSPLTHVKLFGTFLMIHGLTDFLFGIHSRDEHAINREHARQLRALRLPRPFKKTQTKNPTHKK